MSAIEMFGYTPLETLLLFMIVTGILIALKLAVQITLSLRKSNSSQILGESLFDESTLSEAETDEKIPEPSKPERKLTPEQELAEREKKLKERHDAIKNEKMKELAEREEKINTRKPASKPENKDETEWFSKMGESEQAKKKNEITEHLSQLEKKYENQEISQDHYHKMKAEYEKQLYDIGENNS